MIASSSFFISGKGGTGKSTVSSLLSLFLSKNKRVLLISLDPAHSLSSIWQTKRALEPIQINSSISIFEPDIAELIKNTVDKAKFDIRARYRFLDSFNANSLTDILSICPGIEEQALWETVANYTEKFTGTIVFDAPPTGQAQKLLSVPVLMKTWSEHLNNLADEISRLSERIWKTKSENHRKIQDITSSALKTAVTINGLLKKTSFITVVNDNPLSKLEAEHFEMHLKVLDLKKPLIFTNMTQNPYLIPSLENFGTDLYGINHLESIIESYPDVFRHTIDLLNS